MVNDRGQLYTMEGVAAGIIMLLTAYIVISTTSIYTPGDTHIPDMQLEQLGSDVLAMMDTPNSKEDDESQESDLVTYILATDKTSFRAMFRDYCNMRAGSGDDLKMNAYVYFHDRDTGTVRSYVLDEEDHATGRENAVRVTRWVQLPERPDNLPMAVTDIDNRPQAVLLEVLLWRT
ncbi:hypothetical protein SZ63_06190 [Methanoculleus sediminis]|uniref:Uncharacterized protein n=1 Tax=Methanoculleus sediminis TaxID=1550566 RepID=A0A0H1R0I9_9EURY|nr:hypothetical protein [Methanoculleus sediminis]KLK88589.1 hypothetical protein SZ63_06190 [Methanoculleus sediminis]